MTLLPCRKCGSTPVFNDDAFDLEIWCPVCSMEDENSIEVRFDNPIALLDMHRIGHFVWNHQQKEAA